MKEKVLTEKQRRAVELLFEHKEAEVAKKLRISRETLEMWFSDVKFRQAINVELRGCRRASVRMLAKLYLNATMQLDEMIHEKEIGNRHKVIVDILKASGLLKGGVVEEEDEPGYVERLIERLQNEEDEEEDDPTSHQASNFARATSDKPLDKWDDATQSWITGS